MLETTTQTDVAATDRDSRGRFCGGGTGKRKLTPAERGRRLRQAMQSAVGPRRLRRIVQSLATAAEGGDIKAAELVLRYSIGSPEAYQKLLQGDAATPATPTVGEPVSVAEADRARLLGRIETLKNVVEQRQRGGV